MPFQMKGFLNKSQPKMSTNPVQMKGFLNKSDPKLQGFNVNNLNVANNLNITSIPAINTSAIPSTQSEEQKLYEAARKSLEEALENIKDTSAPTISVEGIALSTGPSPVSVSASSSNVVSIVQDAVSDDVTEQIQKSSQGLHPVILSSVKMPSISTSAMDDAIEVSQFERQIVKEAVIMGLQQVIKSDPKGTATAAKNSAKKSVEEIKKQVSALAYMQETANTAATGLDITKLSSQIMQRASDALGPLIVPSEVSNKALPQSLDEYIALTFPSDSVKLGIDDYLTNTTRLVVLAQDMMLAALSCHPTVLQHFSRNSTSSDSLSATSAFMPPGAYGYDPDGPGGAEMVMIPTVSQLFAVNKRSIVSQFQGSKSIDSPREMLGVLNRGNSASITESWDAVLHLITCLSNEMIMSAGIGRLIGSSLGARFLEVSRTNVEQFSPFDRVLGFSPAASANEVSKFFTTGPDRRGSFLDYLALGEEDSLSKFIVMPFEVNTVNSQGKLYVSGKKYFIDLAIQTTDENAVSRRDALKRFATDISTFTKDMSAYVTELLALDVNTNLLPQTLLARVLQDFSTVLASFDRPADLISSKSATAAALFARAGHDPDRQTTFSSTKAMVVTLSDIIKMSVVRALNDFDKVTKDTTFALSNGNTQYQTVSAERGENPELNLENAILSLQERGADDISILSAPSDTIPDQVSRVTYGYSSTEVLYDTDFSSSKNIINLIARTIRETQKEALNLAQRNGAKIDYRNSSGGTYLSNCDDDRFIDVMCEIYTRLAYLLLPMSVHKSKIRLASSFNMITDINAQSIATCNAAVSSIVRSLMNGEQIDPDALQFDSQVDPGTALSAGGENTKVTKAADIAIATARIPGHRYYIKSSLKILESISSGVSAASSKMSVIFDILNNNVKKEKLKDLDLELYDLFVTNRLRNEEFLRNMSEQQTNLCAASLYNHISSDDVFLRRDIDISRSERLAVRDFIKSIYEEGEMDELQVMSIGLPSGIIESLYRSTINLEDSGKSTATAGTEGQKLGRYVKIEIDRHDNVHYNSKSSMEINVMFQDKAAHNIFDPEIFILPDSIEYDPANKPVAESTLEAIILMTTFYRIRNGVVIEKTPGAFLEPSQIIVYGNALRSYLLDIYLYETVKIRYIDGISPYGVPRLTRQGYDLISETSSSDVLSKSVMSAQGFAKLFNDKTYSLHESDTLSSLLESTSVERSPDFSETDVYFASVLASLYPLASTDGVIAARPYERVYNVLYDESIAREHITDAGDDRKAKRKQFDIYTLSTRVTYGGSL